MKIVTIDIGRTSIKSAVSIEGELIDVQENNTNAQFGGMYVLEEVKRIIQGYNEYSFDRIGISTAGQVNSMEGKIVYANKNIPGYTGMPIKNILEAAFQVPVSVENDVNAAAIGESCWGAGRGEQQFVCLTYGTGVGGAIFVDGKLYSGSSFSAAEFGGIIVHPEERDYENDMFSGCYERYASTGALVQKARKIDETLVNGRVIFSRLGEAHVKRVVDAWIDEILYGLVTVIHMMNPSLVILGGGVMEQEYILVEIQKRIKRQVMPSYCNVQIKKAELGNRAGLIGACVLAGRL